MSPRSSGPVQRPVAVALCLMLACVGFAAVVASKADAANYKMVLCAAGNGSNGFDTATNTTSPQNPGGIFSFENHCGPAPDPAGNHAFLRIAENQSAGSAGESAYGSISWTVPPWVAILAAGGYTREPAAFNDGWRGRFWGEDFGGGGHHILLQGAGLPNSDFRWAPTPVFASHLWPFPAYGNYRRFVFELTCMRPGRCDNAGLNAVDANTIVLVLSDEQSAQVAFTNGSPLMQGGWVRGSHSVTWNVSEKGSGLRWERLLINGAQRHQIDHGPACDLGSSQPNGEFARRFQPCPTGGPYAHSYTLDTATVPDGSASIEICAEDYGQAVGLNGTGSDSCERRSIHVDNTAPGAPSGLRVRSANPQRYLERFDAVFSLPPNEGSPIVKVHYQPIDAAGRAVMPEQVLTGTNPTEIIDVSAPSKPGDYRLRVWLEDAVGHLGAPALAPIPRDTTPPAAPQSVSVAAPTTSRVLEGFDLRWRNIRDEGSPIDAAHYQVLDRAGSVVVPTTDVAGESIEAISDLRTPRERGSYILRLWLSDAEGNVGAPISAPLAYDCVRSEASGGVALSAGLGAERRADQVVRQGEGATLTGTLRGAGSGAAGAALCVFSSVLTDTSREFLGIALSAEDGSYRFAIEPGPSRGLSVLYRPDQRQLHAEATLYTRVRPTFEVKRRVVRNGQVAHFFGEIPGPHNDHVVVVLQVKQGEGWRAFRRYRTRANGRYALRWRFTHTTAPTTYVMRAQVRSTVGYPYLQGDSRPLAMRVVP